MWYTDKNRIKDFSDSRTANVRVVSIFYFVAFVSELLLNRSKMSPSCSALVNIRMAAFFCVLSPLILHI